MSKRLTEPGQDFELQFCRECGCDYYGEPNGCNSPDYICEGSSYFTEVAEKLRKYEDAEEAGRLKMLPIEIDGRAWIIDDNTVIPVRIMDYQIGDDGLAAHVECLAPPAWITINAARLYKSKEEAEAALKAGGDDD